jgi:hypothetical protein
VARRTGKQTAKTRRTPRFNEEGKKTEMGIPLNFCLPDLNLLGALGSLAVKAGLKSFWTATDGGNSVGS